MPTSTLPTVQTVVYQPDPRSPDLVLGEALVPLPGPDECLIAVKATSPVPGELTWEVLFPSLFPQNMNPLERIPASEASGVVVTAPPNGQWKPGDEVFYRSVAREPGSLRRFAARKADQLALKPKSMDWIQASAVALSSLTAYQGIFDHGGIEREALWGDEAARKRNSQKRILVLGASGNVGMVAVQLAWLAGSTVVGVSGPGKVQDVLDLGASEVIDYTKQTIAEYVSQDESKLFDLALDFAGKDSLQGCFYAVKDGGILLSAVESPEARRPPEVSRKFSKCEWYLMPHSNTRDLTEIAKLIDAGKVKIWIDSVYEFEQYDEAFRKISGRTKGKVVIKVDC